MKQEYISILMTLDRCKKLNDDVVLSATTPLVKSRAEARSQAFAVSIEVVKKGLPKDD